jgi:hypothetical protein
MRTPRSSRSKPRDPPTTRFLDFFVKYISDAVEEEHAEFGMDRSSALLFGHGDFNFSSTYSESSTIRSTSCAGGSPAKFLSTSSFT